MWTPHNRKSLIDWDSIGQATASRYPAYVVVSVLVRAVMEFALRHRHALQAALFKPDNLATLSKDTWSSSVVQQTPANSSANATPVSTQVPSVLPG